MTGKVGNGNLHGRKYEYSPVIRWRLTLGPSSTVAPVVPLAAYTSESFSAFLSAAVRTASDSLPASISAR